MSFEGGEEEVLVIKVDTTDRKKTAKQLVMESHHHSQKSTPPHKLKTYGSVTNAKACVSHPSYLRLSESAFLGRISIL